MGSDKAAQAGAMLREATTQGAMPAWPGRSGTEMTPIIFPGVGLPVPPHFSTFPSSD
jgi:hypothetical protein